MNKLEHFVSNKRWLNVYEWTLLGKWKKGPYVESIGAHYYFNPVTDHIMSNNSTLFDIKKAAAMYFWYRRGDRTDDSIIKYFNEYKKCIDENHNLFNSNYGYYAYTQNGLQKCIDELIYNRASRQACFCINSNIAMSESSIDKVCTNVIHFFIRDNSLRMVVQMRSSNFVTLLPYDAFMFSVFYMHVYKKLKHEYSELKTGIVDMQVASLHYFTHNVSKLKLLKEPQIQERIIDFESENCEAELEKYLLNKLTEL